jgi:hypothetical protein
LRRTVLTRVYLTLLQTLWEGSYRPGPIWHCCKHFEKDRTHQGLLDTVANTLRRNLFTRAYLTLLQTLWEGSYSPGPTWHCCKHFEKDPTHQGLFDIVGNTSRILFTRAYLTLLQTLWEGPYSQGSTRHFCKHFEKGPTHQGPPGCKQSRTAAWRAAWVSTPAQHDAAAGPPLWKDHKKLWEKETK